MATTDHILRLTQIALEEFDDRPLTATIRRAVRIANLLGDAETAVRLGLELKPIGGDVKANAEDTKRLLVDDSLWGDPKGPVESALGEYMEDRRLAPGKVQSMSIAEMEFWDKYVEGEEIGGEDILEGRIQGLQMLERIRHRTFTALCAWERELTLGGTTEAIFGRFERRVQRLLSEGAPRLIDQFNAVARRLRDAALLNPTSSGSEDLAQAVTTCRRILKAVTDYVFPGEVGLVSADGHVLDDEKYRNRIREFAKAADTGDRMRAAIEAAVVGLCDRFDALDGLASKGVHADIAVEEAELCAITTFVVTGEIVRIHEMMSET